MKLACDIGGVVREMRRGEVISGALEALKELQKHGISVLFISKCGPGFRQTTKEWLRAQGLQNIPLYFCLEYSEKAKIARQQGVTAIIDDKLAVLREFPIEIVKIWFAPEVKQVEGAKKYQGKLFDTLRVASDWNVVLDILGLEMEPLR